MNHFEGDCEFKRCAGFGSKLCFSVYWQRAVGGPSKPPEHSGQMFSLQELQVLILCRKIRQETRTLCTLLPETLHTLTVRNKQACELETNVLLRGFYYLETYIYDTVRKKQTCDLDDYYQSGIRSMSELVLAQSIYIALLLSHFGPHLVQN